MNCPSCYNNPSYLLNCEMCHKNVICEHCWNNTTSIYVACGDCDQEYRTVKNTIDDFLSSNDMKGLDNYIRNRLKRNEQTKS